MIKIKIRLTSVALVSAPKITPSLNTIPAMVVPVFTGLGNFIPARFRSSFLVKPRI